MKSIIKSQQKKNNECEQISGENLITTTQAISDLDEIFIKFDKHITKHFNNKK